MNDLREGYRPFDTGVRLFVNFPTPGFPGAGCYTVTARQFSRMAHRSGIEQIITIAGAALVTGQRMVSALSAFLSLAFRCSVHGGPAVLACSRVAVGDAAFVHDGGCGLGL